MVGIVFFDADKTLWRVLPQRPGDDWVSKLKSPKFKLEDNKTVVRKQDGTKFILKDGVKECLAKLSLEGIGVGIVSDNRPEDVAKVAGLFGIWDYFDPTLVNIKLWDGPCPKDQMVTEVIDGFGKDKPSNILLVDDKDYSKAMRKLGYSFLLSPKNTFPKNLVSDFFRIK